MHSTLPPRAGLAITHGGRPTPAGKSDEGVARAGAARSLPLGRSGDPKISSSPEQDRVPV